MRLPSAKPSAWPLLAATLSLQLAFMGCDLLGKDPGDAPIVLHLSLDDSLTRYDRVVVDVTSASDTARVLETLWTGPLPIPPQIPAHTLTVAKDPFLVKVRGYRGAGQLAVETLIFYEGGRKRVVHNALPPLVPYNLLGRLNPSPGVLDPPFNAEILNYNLSVPANASTVSFDVMAAYSKASTTVNGQTVKIGDPPVSIPVTKAGFAVPIKVTDLGASRTYTINVIPPKSIPLQLDSMAWTSGTMDPPFNPAGDFFTLTIPSNEVYVDLQFWPTDPSNTILEVNAKNSLPGTKHRFNLAEPGASTVVTVQVKKGGQFKDYTLIVKRAE